jgi:hypothetical protein
MPVQRIIRGGETFYRWGESGKEYRNRADAEAQGRAAYASGYREPTQTRDQNAERAGRQVARDIEYDDMRSGTREPARMRDARAERAGRRVTKDIEYDMKRKRR